MIKSSEVNRQVVLRKKADGKPSQENFEVKEVPIPEPKDGEVLVRVLYLSVDPYMRGRIGSDEKKSSSKPLEVGQVIVGATVGQVVQSCSDEYKAGDIVHAYSGWQSFYTKPADQVTRINTSWNIPLSKFVGVMGMTGLTSFYGLTYIGEPKAGETVVVSGAAGAVGNVVCQIAKIYGCRVVGIAGSQAKVDYLKDVVGVDAAIDYHTPDLAAALAVACPNGVDVYYDNTGGVISDTVIPLINKKARIIICGQISDYNTPNGQQSMGPRLNHHLLWKSAKMQGFLVQDFEEKDEATFQQLAQWINSGQLKTVEDVVEGIENAPSAFLKLFDGSNFGKVVVHVADV